jgi:zeaxanthin epoxidase
MAKAIAALLLTTAQALQAPHARPTPTRQQAAAVAEPTTTELPDAISAEHPLRVVIAGAGVGGLTLANALKGCDHVDVQLIEKTSAFKRFGGPIQLASNAMQLYKELDSNLYDQIESKFTWTGNLTNGIKDGIRDEWYAKFDLASPARDRGMPYTGVIERPDLQEILLGNLDENVVQNGVGVHSYTTGAVGSRITGPVDVKLEDDNIVAGDVLVGADGIWSQVRAAMRDEPARGDGSGVAYSGYTVFAGELAYDSPDNGEVGYKVYIGPNQYFVITV